MRNNWPHKFRTRWATECRVIWFSGTTAVVVILEEPGIGAQYEDYYFKTKRRSGDRDSATIRVALHHPQMAATAAAPALAAEKSVAVDDPNLRQVVDLRGMQSFRIQGRIGGSICNANKIRIQYNTSGNINCTTWHNMGSSGGEHTLNEMFHSRTRSIPEDAQINNCVIRAVLHDGDGVASPTITCCIVQFYLGEEEETD